MNNARFLSLADLAITQFLIRSGGARYFLKNQLLPVVILREVKFKRMLTFPRKYKIHTRMAYWEEEYYCWHQVFEEGGKYAAEIFTLGVVLKRGTRDKKSPIEIARDMLNEDILPDHPGETILELIRRAKERPILEEVLKAFTS